MSLLHLSISANDPENVASFLAAVMGGIAMPFPPFPDCWIAFSAEDDGTAIEVYPTTHVLEAGPEQISCEIKSRDTTSTFVHAAVCSKLSRVEIIGLASSKGWTSRICNRGPFECVEVWLENRLLVELLDAEMQKDYREGMTASNWASMFGLSK
ncbi:hypothetical protein GGR95_000247 [Sulfitobacter undariae]|uniref:VOC domain-containing protein n=1 Tax=Sulfitobacter undariae TaxID=1563671 RepID=A0A7W6GZI4_9RHOB|nr:hypothetical protein [Sulfitobacter undariae]MBB3992628.1 hypothetical protein [Sulfitobacter undariae]